MPATDAPETRRLAKAVADLVPCSRRDAEEYIAQGWVRVDGTTVEEPQFRVTASQRVEVDPQARLQPVLPATLLLHKPAAMASEAAQSLLAAASRWSGDRSGIRRVKSHGVRLAALLPLPDAASGLVVFSQDRGVVRKLSEDGERMEQELLAEVRGTLAPDGLARLCHGLVRAGRPLPPARVSWQSEARLRFAVKGIAPDLVAWMCAQVGLELTGLKRIRIGRVPMAGLPPGQWRYLAPGERF